MKFSRFALFAAISSLLIGLLAGSARADSCSEQAAPGPLTSLFQKIIRATCLDCDKLHVSCDLLEASAVPEVIFLGERHDNALSIKTRKAVLAASSRGRFPLASEIGMSGGLLPWESGNRNIQGLETMIPYGVFMSYHYQRAFVDREETSDLLVGSVAYSIQALPLFSKAYADLKERSPGVCPGCFSIMDRAVADLSARKPDATKEVTSDRRLDRLFSQMRKVDASQRSRFIDELDRRVLAIVREKYSDLIPPASLPHIETKAEAEDFGIIEGGAPRDGSRLDRIVLDLRNRLFAEQIANNLCHYRGKSTHLVVILGDAHVAGVSRLLDGLTGGRLESRHLRTWDSSDVQEFSAMSQSMKCGDCR